MEQDLEVSDGGRMVIDGSATTIHHNVTFKDTNNPYGLSYCYGLHTNRSSSIHLKSPLTLDPPTQGPKPVVVHVVLSVQSVITPAQTFFVLAVTHPHVSAETNGCAGAGATPQADFLAGPQQPNFG